MEHIDQTYDTIAEMIPETSAEDFADMDMLFENSFDHPLSEIIASAEVYFGDRTFTYAHRSGTYAGTAAQVLDACPHAQTIAGQGGFDAFASWIVGYETIQEEGKEKHEADESVSSLESNKPVELEITTTKAEPIQAPIERTPPSVPSPKEVAIVPTFTTDASSSTTPPTLKDIPVHKNVEAHSVQPLSTFPSSTETNPIKEPSTSIDMPQPVAFVLKPPHSSAQEIQSVSLKPEIEIDPTKSEITEALDTQLSHPDEFLEAAPLEGVSLSVSAPQEHSKNTNITEALHGYLFETDVLAPSPDASVEPEAREEIGSTPLVEPEIHKDIDIVLPIRERLIEAYLMDAREIATSSAVEKFDPIIPKQVGDIPSVTHDEFIPEPLDYQEIALTVFTEDSETTSFNKALGAEGEPIYSVQPVREQVIACQDLPVEIAFALLETVVRTKEDIINTNEHETEDLHIDLQIDPSYDELVFRLTRLRIEIAYAKPTPSKLFEQLPESLQVQLLELLVELGYNNPHETMSSLLRRQDLAYVISFILHLVSILERETMHSLKPTTSIISAISVAAISELPHLRSRLGRFVIGGLAITRDTLSCPYPHAQVAA